MKCLLKVVPLLATLVAAGAWAQPVELRLASPAPPQSAVNTRGLEQWVKDVTAASEGTLSVRLMAGPVLANFENVYDRVLRGIADIGFGTGVSVGGQFRKSEVATLPFETENVRETSAALWRSQERGLIADDYSQVRPLALFSFPHSVIHTKTVKVKYLTDVKGIKMGVGGKLGGDVAAALGAAPITLSSPEVYQSLSSGMVESMMTAWTAVESFKLYEVVKNHFSAPLSSTTAYVVMNKRSYERLPAAAKAAIDRYSGEVFSRKMGDVVQALDDAARDRVKNLPGHTFETIAPEEQARWRKQLEGITADWVKSTPNGAAILSGFREEIRKLRAGQ